MSMQAAVDAVLKSAIDRGDVPGVLALATDKSSVLYENGFGERVLGSGVAMTPDTVVWIASMTKAVTGAAAMQLVEQGTLHLDRAASHVLPELGRVQVFDGFDSDGKAKLRRPTSEITLRHLLTHTSGFSYDIWNADLAKYQEQQGIPGVISCENAALSTPLTFDPGERWDYGIGIDWAGKMVEAVSGQKLGDYLKDNLFSPLGMNDTAFKITDQMRARMAKIHARGEDDSLVATDIEIPQEPEFEMGGGGLYSTIGDYGKFVRMILNDGQSDDGEAVLKPDTVRTMSTNQMGDTRVAALKTAMPPYSNDAEFFPGMPKTWGLSFMINTEQAPTGRSAGSLAWAGLANSYYWIDPSRGIGGVYATQIIPFVDKKSLPLFLDFEKTVYDQLN